MLLHLDSTLEECEERTAEARLGKPHPLRLLVLVLHIRHHRMCEHRPHAARAAACVASIAFAEMCIAASLPRALQDLETRLLELELRERHVLRLLLLSLMLIRVP